MINSYWELVQAKICHKCTEGDHQGNCRLPAGEQCSLKAFLPEIVTTIVNMRSASYQAYVNALRNNVCISCTSQRADGSCWKRDTLECVLDRYYPLVIEVIESVKVDAKNFQPGRVAS